MDSGPKQEAKDAYHLSNPGILKVRQHVRWQQDILDGLFRYNVFE
jgi:hypothetical protein